MFTWFRHRAIDRELTQILDEHERVRSDASLIRDFLLRVLADNRDGVEKFSDEALADAAAIIDQVGPGAFYWMTDIAAQLAFLAAAQINGIPTNIDAKVGESATPEAIVNAVVKG